MRRAGVLLARRFPVGFKTLQELRAYGAARELKLEIYRLVKAHPQAFAEFSHSLRISRASLEETTCWLQDGIDREYFPKGACRRAFDLADETGRLTVGLIVSLRPFLPPRARDRGPRPRDAGRPPDAGGTPDPERTPDSERTPDPEDGP